jgi:hypothetical protein
MRNVLTTSLALLVLIGCGDSERASPGGAATAGIAGFGGAGAGLGGVGVAVGGAGEGGTDGGSTASGGAPASSGDAGDGGAAGTVGAGGAMGGAGGEPAGAGGAAGAGNMAGGGTGAGEDCRSNACPGGEYCRVTEYYVCPGEGPYGAVRFSGRCVAFETDCQGASSCSCANQTCMPGRCTEQDGEVQVVCWEGCWG